jgi:hypothetical protein
MSSGTDFYASVAFGTFCKSDPNTDGSRIVVGPQCLVLVQRDFAADGSGFKERGVKDNRRLAVDE